MVMSLYARIRRINTGRGERGDKFSRRIDRGDNSGREKKFRHPFFHIAGVEEGAGRQGQQPSVPFCDRHFCYPVPERGGQRRQRHHLHGRRNCVVRSHDTGSVPFSFRRLRISIPRNRNIISRGSNIHIRTTFRRGVFDEKSTLNFPK